MKKNVKERVIALFATLGFTKEKQANMTNEDWNKFNASYKETYGISFQEDLETPDETPEGTQGTATVSIPENMQSQILAALTEAAEATGNQAPTTAPTTIDEAMASFVGALNSATSTIRTLAAAPENDSPAVVISGSGSAMNPQAFAIVMGHAPHTETHLFGIESDYFKRGSWWSELVATGKGKENYRDEDATEFRAAFNNYTKDFQARCIELATSNQIGLLDYGKMLKGESYLDYSNMNAKLGEHVVRRMDTVIAYLRTLKSVASIFPKVSNVQNKLTAPTAHFEELSQSYLSGHHFKGAVNFDGEIYHVDDVMFKFFFDDPKQLEKEYIGYMNREGSNPMKWTLFEWCIVHFGTILFNEQQRRHVIGYRVPRQGEFPQPAMFAADGGLRAIQRVEEELKVLPFKELKQYDRITMVDYSEEFFELVMGILPNMTGYRLHANEKHQPWYLKGFRNKYGKDTDFTGVKNFIADLSPENIIWVPNMDMVDYKMWITIPGNVENYEDKLNEMYAFYFQQDLEQLIMASWWKEGSGVLAPGVQFNMLEDLENSERKLQWLFTNYPVVVLDPDATSIDGRLGFEIETSENTTATALTDISNVHIDRVYKIICGSTENATTIAKSGNFSEITAAWNPTAVGDYIKVYAQLEQVTKTVGNKQKKVVQPTGKFLELERKVS
ncbi:hypothetical protein D0T49_01960 [Paludibacter sp. 221]|uniref:hypothetical protein n=1 Tax=Paludibacter sp. 221 TaxID=2302939 RepID=UPI0013D2E4C2|nr:hypothetical protein [Paludibacter sp. 221]NDV45815.1 hypothetical protein [Paludibacter sp. 221]